MPLDSSRDANALRDTMARVRVLLDSVQQDVIPRPTQDHYAQNILHSTLLQVDPFNMFLRLLNDLERDLQFVYLDAKYRSNSQFNLSLDLSEIYAYANPLFSRDWASIIRFSIEHQELTKRHYHVLPTTIIEVLAFLRRHYRSHSTYEDYRVLQSFLENPGVTKVKHPDTAKEVSIADVAREADILPYRDFLGYLVAADQASAPRKGDPAHALAQLLASTSIKSVDNQLKTLFDQRRHLLAKYGTAYQDVLRGLNQGTKRGDLLFNNSIDARSYQLSLALNDFFAEYEHLAKPAYLPILSRGAPLYQFSQIDWALDPLKKSVIGDSNVEIKDSHICTLARGPHYHYLSTVLNLRHPNDPVAIGKAVAASIREIKGCINSWSEVIRHLDYAGAGRSILEDLIGRWLRLERGAVDLDPLLGNETSARRRVKDDFEYRERFRFGDTWIRKHFPDRDTYHRVLSHNHDRIRDEIFDTVSRLPATIELFIAAEREAGTAGSPDILRVLEWIEGVLKEPRTPRSL